jgi:hypothetical protein
MNNLLTVYTHRGAVIGNYKAERAAYLIDIPRADLEWAIEEYGRCDGTDGVALPWGERFETYDEWYAKQTR